MTVALEGTEWSAARPRRTLPPGKTRYPFYRRLGGPQGRSGRAENLVPTGIRSRIVQPVVSRYTDWAKWPTLNRYNKQSILFDSSEKPFEPCSQDENGYVEEGFRRKNLSHETLVVPVPRSSIFCSSCCLFFNVPCIRANPIEHQYNNMKRNSLMLRAAPGRKLWNTRPVRIACIFVSMYCTSGVRFS